MKRAAKLIPASTVPQPDQTARWPMNRGVKHPHTLGRSPSGLRLLKGLLLVFLLAGSGCRVVEQTARLPMKTVAAVVPGKQTALIEPAALQAELLRYADDFFSRTSAGVDAYVRLANTPQARSEALGWKLALNSSALGIATGPSPTANLVDFLALSSLTRAFLERRAADAVPPGAFDLWLEASQVLESNAWCMAERILTTEQQKEFQEHVGSNTTLLLRLLQDREIEISPDEATVMMLGIYEDTGNLTFPSAKEDDFKAAGYLVRKGANLNILSNVITKELTAEQVFLLNDLIQSASRFHVQGTEVVIAQAASDRYIGDIAVLAHKLLDMENLDVLFVLVRMEDRVYLIGRSRVEEVNVAEVASRNLVEGAIRRPLQPR